MDTFQPFQSQIHEAAATVLAAQKQVASFGTEQVKLAATQAASALELVRAGFDAQVSASLALSQMMVDRLAPKAA